MYRPSWPAILAALSSAAWLQLAVAASNGITISGIVASVKYQRPGIQGYPKPVEFLLQMLLNKPKALADNMTLVDGDGLFGDSEESTVQLVCPNGGTQTLIGKFNATINIGPDGSRCKITLRSATGIATTPGGSSTQSADFPVEIEAGEVTLGARSTQFGASVVSGANSDAPKSDAFVVEGSIDVTRRGNASTVTVRSGQLLASNNSVATAISQSTFERLAVTYAAIDTVRLPAAKQAEVRNGLRAAYIEALSRPSDLSAQSRLIQSYQSAHVASPSLDYRQQHVSRLRAMTTMAPDIAGAIRKPQ